MTELSGAEQRYKAVLAIISNSKTVTDAAAGALTVFWPPRPCSESVRSTRAHPYLEALGYCRPDCEKACAAAAHHWGNQRSDQH